MGGSCSSNRRGGKNAIVQGGPRDWPDFGVRNPRRHSVDLEVPDHALSSLYPVEDNYVNDDAGSTRSPKSLVKLCTDTVCRHLADLHGDIPPGIPQDIVDSILKSLVTHSALNATTLKKLRRCELFELPLGGCRGVDDEWLLALNSENTAKSTSYNNLAALHDDAEESTLKGPNNEPYIQSQSCCDGDFFSHSTQRVTSAMSSSSSCSTSSFHSAVSTPNAGCTVAKAVIAPSSNLKMMEYQKTPLGKSMSEPETKPSVTSLTTLLDLRGSQRVTDRGLIQLNDLSSLKIAQLDDCHSLVGRGLVAFSRSHQLRVLSLSNCRCLTDEAITNISHLSSITALSLDGCRCLTDIALEGVSRLYQLSKLDLSQCDLLTDKGLKYLHNLKNLEDLSLGWCRSITDYGIGILVSQPRRPETLRNLSLARCQISDQGIVHVGKLEALVELNLNGCSMIGSSALAATLQMLYNLTTLDVSYCPGILRASWQGKINALCSLDLCYCGVRDSHIANWSNLPSLKELNLDSCHVSDWAIAHLADNDIVPNLTSLDFSDTDLTDLGMVHIPKFKKLSHLSLFYCGISNSGLRYLSSMTKLEVLNLDSRDISDDGLHHLCNLQNLKSLDIFSGRVTDIGCAHIAKIQSLQSLELCGGGVTNFGCTHLATLKNLTSLNLSQNDRITNTGASSLVALTKLKALNLSNTRVNAGSLQILSNLSCLQSLALYGCNDINDLDRIRALPSLKCLRVESFSDDDGKIEDESCGDVNIDSENNNEELTSGVFHDDSSSFGSRSSYDDNSSIVEDSDLEYDQLHSDDNRDADGSLVNEIDDDGDNMLMEDPGRGD